MNIRIKSHLLAEMIFLIITILYFTIFYSPLNLPLIVSRQMLVWGVFAIVGAFNTIYLFAHMSDNEFNKYIKGKSPLLRKTLKASRAAYKTAQRIKTAKKVANIVNKVTKPLNPVAKAAANYTASLAKKVLTPVKVIECPKPRAKPYIYGAKDLVEVRIRESDYYNAMETSSVSFDIKNKTKLDTISDVASKILDHSSMVWYYVKIVDTFN